MKKILFLIFGVCTIATPLVIAQTNSEQTINEWTGTVLELTGEVCLLEKPKVVTPKPVEVKRTDLPYTISENQKVLIHGFPEESIANYVATNYYRRADVDMLLTMLTENGWFNIYSKSPTNDYWLCQWHYDSSTKDFIDSPDFYNVDVQMNDCIWLWNLTKQTWRNKTKRTAYPGRWKNAWKITIVDIE